MKLKDLNTQTMKEVISSQMFIKKLNAVCDNFDIYNFSKSIHTYLPHLVELAKTISKNLPDYIPNSQKIRLNNKKKIDIVMSFFNQLDKNLADKITSVLQNQNTSMVVFEKAKHKNNNSQVVSYIDNRGMKACVRLYLDKSNVSLFAIAHEFAHVAFLFNKTSLDVETDLFAEVESLFIEKVFGLWILKNNVVNHKAVLLNNIANKVGVLNTVRDILNEDYIFSIAQPPFDSKKIDEMLKEFESNPYVDSNEMIECVYKMGYANASTLSKRKLRYIVGEICSELMLEDFKKSSSKTIKMLNEYLEISPNLKVYQHFEFLLGDNWKERLDKKYLTNLNKRNNQQNKTI